MAPKIKVTGQQMLPQNTHLLIVFKRELDMYIPSKFKITPIKSKAKIIWATFNAKQLLFIIQSLRIQPC